MQLDPEVAEAYMGMEPHKHQYKQDGVVESMHGRRVIFGYRFECSVCHIEFYVERTLLRNVLMYGCADGYFLGGLLPMIEDVRDGITIHHQGLPWKTDG